MKNIVITIIVIGAVFFLITILDNNGMNYSSADEDRIYELENCLDEFKSAHSEYNRAMNDALGALEYANEGDDYYDLISAIDSARDLLDVGDNTPNCD